MKLACIALTCAVLVVTFPAMTRTLERPPSPAHHAVGLWQAPLEGLPGVILTLSDDSGRLIGGIVFNAGSRNGEPAPRTLGRNARAIMNLRVEGYALRLLVLGRGDRGERERPSA